MSFIIRSDSLWYVFLIFLHTVIPAFMKLTTKVSTAVVAAKGVAGLQLTARRNYPLLHLAFHLVNLQPLH